MNFIFKDNAQKYWDNNIPVMPLRDQTKKAFINGWQEFSHRMPTDAEQSSWLLSYPTNNIGLPLGEQSKIVVVDIDTNDDRVIEAIKSVLPPTPWMRVGQKGVVLAYKYTNEETRRIKDEDGKTVVEILSNRTQIVLPPSIHPDTQRPYVANCELVTVLNELVPLPPDAEERIVKAASKFIKISSTKEKAKFKITEFVPNGARDVSMTQMVGVQSYAVLKGEINVKRAMSNIESWCINNTQRNGNGDDLSVEKAIGKFIEFLIQDVVKSGKILPTGWDENLTTLDIVNYGLDIITEDHKEYTYVQLMEKIHNDLKDISTSDLTGRINVINTLIAKIAKCERLTSIEIKDLLHTIRVHSGISITVADLRRELENLKKGPIEGVSHTEIAKDVLTYYCERIADLRYCDEKFWRWNGMHWEALTMSKDGSVPELRNIISDKYGHLSAAKKASDHRGIIDILKNLVSKPLVTNEIDGVNFKNGVLTTDLRLVPHAPEYGMTYVLDYCYRPELAGKCPRFINHLKESWGDEPDYVERVLMLQEAISTTFFRVAYRYQKVFLLYGQPGSGKNVIMDVIQTMFPSTAISNVEPNMWGDAFSFATMRGKLLNYAGELPDKGNIPGHIFKSTIEGTSRVVNNKYGAISNESITAAHWLCSNCHPRTTDGSAGFNRRWLIWTFNKTVPEHKRIPDLGKSIAYEEVEAIVAWALSEFPNVNRRGHYTIPPSCTKEINTMAVKNNIIRYWLQENIQHHVGGKAYLKTLYPSFWAFVATTTVSGRPPSPPDFFAELKMIIQETHKFETSHDEKGEYINDFILKSVKIN